MKTKIGSGKTLIVMLFAVIAALLFAFAFTFTPETKAYAYKSENLPADNNAIGQIYNDTDGKFDLGRLNALAAKAGYADLTAMNEGAVNGDKKTSEDFGETTVDFGTYTFGGETKTLTWIPVYLSKSDGGDPILTLWLASTENANGAASNQEISTWSDGTYSMTHTAQTYNGSDVHSNTYDGSYVRNYILNGSTDYTKNWGDGTAVTPPDIGTMTKFSQFTGSGALSSYIVTPSNVDWQKNASYMKNDPEWNASGKVTEASGDVGSRDIVGTKDNYPNGWLEDKIWLPSVYETYDSTISSDGTRWWDFTEDGGLWKTGNGKDNRQKRSNEKDTYLRSGFPNDSYGPYGLYANGTACGGGVHDLKAVRPALHLNLKTVAGNAEWGKLYWGVDNKTLTISALESDVSGCAKNGSFSAGSQFEEYTNTAPWKDEDLKKAVIKSGVAPTSTAYWFYQQWMTEIDLSGLDTSNVTNMRCMFWNCSNLKTIDLSKFNTAKASDLSGMFNGCTDLTELDLSAFEITSYANLTDMLRDCDSLTVIKTPKLISGDYDWIDLPCNYWSDGADISRITKNDINKTIYNHENHTGGEATCTAKAKCSICNAEYGELAEHTPATEWSNDESGHWHACTVCGNKTDEAVHDGTDDNDCTTALICSVCDYEMKAAQTSHDFSGNYTGDESGHWHVCSHDGCTQTDTKADHSGTDDNDCTTAVKCSVCDYEMKAAQSHDFTGCYQSDGSQHWHVCGNTDCTQTDTKQSHDGAATCVAKAHCSVCNAEYGEIDANAHNWNDGEITTQPTCTDAGVKTFTCTHDNTHTKTESVEALGHTWGTDATRIEPTCTEDGSVTGVCTVCGANDTQVLEKLGHDLVQHTAKAATCTEKGWNAYKTCLRCDYTTYAEVAALGHTYGEWISETPATETANGVKAHKDCSVCNKHFDEAGTEISDLTIPALGIEQPAQKPDEGLSGGAIAGIAVGSSFGLLIILYVVGLVLYKKGVIGWKICKTLYFFIK